MSFYPVILYPGPVPVPLDFLCPNETVAGAALQSAEVAVSGELIAAVLERASRLRLLPAYLPVKDLNARGLPNRGCVVIH